MYGDMKTRNPSEICKHLERNWDSLHEPDGHLSFALSTWHDKTQTAKLLWIMMKTSKGFFQEDILSLVSPKISHNG